jgi:hypothetical protein
MSTAIIPSSDAELIALCAQALASLSENERANKEVDALPFGTPKHTAGWKAIYERTMAFHRLCGEISKLPARTPAGLRAKAQVAAECLEEERDPVASSLVADILTWKLTA